MTGGRRARPRRNRDKRLFLWRGVASKLREARKGPDIAEIPFEDSDVEASRERVRRRASGSAAPAAAAEVDAHPGGETAREGLRRLERSAKANKCDMSLRTIIGLFICTCYSYEYDISM